MRRSVLIALLLLLASAGVGQAQEPPPTVVSAAIPGYPELARVAAVWATVRVRVVIEPSGMVRHATVERQTPWLANAAVAAAKRWRFRSSETSQTATLTFMFSLLPDDAAEEDIWSTFSTPFTVHVFARKLIVSST